MRNASMEEDVDVRQAFEALSDLCRRLRAGPASERPHVIMHNVEALAETHGKDRWLLVMVLALPPQEIRQPARATATGEGGSLSSETSYAVAEPLLSFAEAHVTRWKSGSDIRSAAAVRALHIREFIDLHYAEPITLQSVAREVSRARSHVAVSFKQETGMTLRQYLLNVRMRHATELLLQGDKVDAVMLLVGYRSKKNFYRQFKSHTGTTPAIYRYGAPPRAHVALPHQTARRVFDPARLTE